LLAGCDNPTSSNGNGNNVNNGTELPPVMVTRTETVEMRDGDLVFNINYTVAEGADTPQSVLDLIARFEAVDASTNVGLSDAVNHLRDLVLAHDFGVLMVNVLDGDSVFAWNAPNFEMGIDSTVPGSIPVGNTFNEASNYIPYAGLPRFVAPVITLEGTILSWNTVGAGFYVVMAVGRWGVAAATVTGGTDTLSFNLGTAPLFEVGTHVVYVFARSTLGVGRQSLPSNTVEFVVPD